MDWFVLLTYFDRKIGPKIFFTYPEQIINEKFSLIIANLMDQISSEEFFIYSFNNHHTLNYYFEINSDWARGCKEMLMLTTVFGNKPSFETEKIIFSLYIEFSEWLKQKEGIFSAFYNGNEISNLNDDQNIALNREHVQLWVKEFYGTVKEEIQDKLEEENIAQLLDRNDVLETLGYISKRGPISLNDLTKWFNKKFEGKNFHKIMIALLKNHMIDIPKIGGKKKSPFIVHISKEIDAIVKLVITKNKLIKQFIKNNIKLHPFKEETQELRDFLKKVFFKT